MNPTPPKKEEEIADAIDRWCEAQRQIEEVDMDLRLKPMFNMAALKVMMVGKAEDFFENVESSMSSRPSEANFEEVLKSAKSTPSARRLDLNQIKGDAMDLRCGRG